MNFLLGILTAIFKWAGSFIINEAKKPTKAKDSTPIPYHIRERWDDRFDDDGLPKQPESGGKPSRFRGQ